MTTGRFEPVKVSDVRTGDKVLVISHDGSVAVFGEVGRGRADESFPWFDIGSDKYAVPVFEDDNWDVYIAT